MEIGLNCAIDVGVGRLTATWDVSDDLPDEFRVSVRRTGDAVGRDGAADRQVAPLSRRVFPAYYLHQVQKDESTTFRSGPAVATPSAPAPSRITSSMKRTVVLVACLLVGVGVLITAVDELRSPGTDQNMHVVQAQAFLDGHLDISKDLADVSIYHGKGYSPFPPGPVVVVLPFVAVLGDRVEIAILLGLALWVLSAWFVRRICSNVGVPPVQANLLTAGAVLGTGAWAVARHRAPGCGTSHSSSPSPRSWARSTRRSGAGRSRQVCCWGWRSSRAS